MATQVEFLTGLVNVAIPEVYQRGMSYYEVLTAVVNKVNELIEQSNEYFGQEVKDVMTEVLLVWKNDGSLAEIIDTAIYDNKLDTDDFNSFVAQYNVEKTGKQAMTANEDGPMVELANGSRPNYIEFAKDGFDVKGSVGALGSYEMNMSYNMDYADNIHRFYDKTKNAWWLAMGDAGVYLQFAPKNYMPDDDIWYNQGSPINWRIDAGGSQFVRNSIFLGENYPDSPSKYAYIESLSDFRDLVINSRKSQYFNIDTSNVSISQGFFWQTNERDPLDPGGTTLMVLKENGYLGVGETFPTSKLHVKGLANYADNASAVAGGLTTGAFYHTAGVVKVVI